jgi:hypothetical protein
VVGEHSASKGIPSVKGKGKVATVDSTTDDKTVPREVKSSLENLTAESRPATKDKGKGKAVVIEDAPNSGNAQMDGPALENQSAIQESSSEDESKFNSAGTSNLISGRRKSYSERASSGKLGDSQRTGSSSRRPPANAATIQEY